jgi:uncharacterized protein YbjT (DUF2867 family)
MKANEAMRILVVGATGYLGRQVVRALAGAGHEVVAGVRDEAAAARLLPGRETVLIDFAGADLALLGERLRTVDVVVNAVGIFQERAEQGFDEVHASGAIRLFEACAAAGVRRVVQISALGSDALADSRYHRSKAAADDALARLAVEWVVVRPSLVIGEEGASWRLFGALSLLPFIPSGSDDLVLQPVAIDDLCRAVVAAVTSAEAQGRVIDLVSPAPLSLRAYLDRIGDTMGRRPRRRLSLPWPLLRALARLAWLKPGLPMSPEALRMLQGATTTYDVEPCRQALGFTPQPVSEFLAATPPSRRERLAARLYFAAPIVRVVLASMWLWSGIVSLGLYPVDDSLALLAQTGIAGPLAYPVLVAAAACDIALGVWVLLTRSPGRAALAQAALILSYTLILTVFTPALWLHPFGPVMKNVPILALISLWRVLEEET